MIRGGGIALAFVLLAAAPRATAQTPLFDGRSLDGWERSDFLGAGKVEVGEGTILLHRGDPLTGITWRGEFPRLDYEVTLEAMRVEGSDFFAAITFPVGDDPCTLVLGGWGGRLVGLSSIAGADASENGTRRSIAFENGRWYAIRLRVTSGKIEAWLDGAQIVDFAHPGQPLSIRVEVWESQPFGIATWQTTGRLRNLALRPLH